jgi:hypothetical protein
VPDTLHLLGQSLTLGYNCIHAGRLVSELGTDAVTAGQVQLSSLTSLSCEHV